MKRTRHDKLSDQMKRASEKPSEEELPFRGNTEQMISTGSTLLDLAITGGRVRGGGLPGGILVEIFGPSGSGKTVLLCEIAGAIQRQGGQVMFRDPEARLNQQFAAMFDLDVSKMVYDNPSTVPEVFAPVREWEPQPQDRIHGVFADSLAALSTDLEEEGKDGMGLRRPKEFSEEGRKTCRILTKKNFLMVCSNQVRQNISGFGHKYITPGGEAIGYYASVRLRCESPTKIKLKKTIKGNEITRVVGVRTEIEVFKNSTWQPNHTALVTINFSYGVDDIGANLQYIKTNKGLTTYEVNGESLSKTLYAACLAVEEQGLVKELREETINLWEEIEEKFKQPRRPKR